jgi:predicted secreted protein
LGRIFAATAVICALLFIFWFLIIHGPGTNLGSKA